MRYTCEEDFVAPNEILVAAAEGNLQVLSCIGWLDLGIEDFDGARNGTTYRIKPEN